MPVFPPEHRSPFGYCEARVRADRPPSRFASPTRDPHAPVGQRVDLVGSCLSLTSRSEGPFPAGPSFPSSESFLLLLEETFPFCSRRFPLEERGQAALFPRKTFGSFLFCSFLVGRSTSPLLEGKTFPFVQRLFGPGVVPPRRGRIWSRPPDFLTARARRLAC